MNGLTNGIHIASILNMIDKNENERIKTMTTQEAIEIVRESELFKALEKNEQTEALAYAIGTLCQGKEFN